MISTITMVLAIVLKIAGSKPGTSPIFNISSTAIPARKATGVDDFLNSESDKNDYDW